MNTQESSDDPYDDIPNAYLSWTKPYWQALSDGDLVECVVFSLLRMVGIARRSDDGWLPLVPRPFRAIYAVWSLNGEVNNGGLDQYFWNTDGEQIDAARDGLAIIGAAATSQVFERAVKSYEANRSILMRFKRVAVRLLNSGLRRKAWEKFAESYKHSDLESLTSEFYRTESDLKVALVNYIRRHLDQFVLDKATVARSFG
jgi:hypothetical protein